MANKVTESSATNPEDQWLANRKPFEKAYAEINPYMSNLEKDAIMSVAAEPGASPRRWGLACREAKLNYSGVKVPVQRVIEVYRAGGTWDDWRRWRNEQDAKPVTAKQQMPPELAAVYQRLAAEAEAQARASEGGQRATPEQVAEMRQRFKAGIRPAA